jgi:hypothetical protein
MKEIRDLKDLTIHDDHPIGQTTTSPQKGTHRRFELP